jgi:hypothetical protein
MLIGVRGVKAVGPRLVSQFNIAKFSLAPKKNTRKLVLFIQEIKVIFDKRFQLGSTPKSTLLHSTDLFY